MAKSQHLTQSELREKILALVADQADGMSGPELQLAIFGDTNDVDEHRRRNQNLGLAARTLFKAKRLSRSRDGGPRGVIWKLAKERPEPVVADLPENPQKTGRGHYPRKPRASANGAVNGDPLRRFMFRTVKTQVTALAQMIAELEEALT